MPKIIYSDNSKSKKVLLLIGLYILVLGSFSCQDKYLMGYTPTATGSLKIDSTGNCLPKTITGTYTAGKAINDSNFIVVTVNVKSTGTYTIKTGTVNGFSFLASGTFSVTGLNQIKLPAKGTPLTAGVNIFEVSFDTSICKIAITVLPVGGAVTPPATYTFQGSPNTCMNAVVSGIYAKGAVPDTLCKISVSVNVTVAGTYSITTNTVNGYKFSSSGTFGVTGLQTVVLTVSGTPLNAGIDNFTVSGSSSTCTIPVTVVTPVAIANTDHFPLTHNSYWNYDDLLNSPDTLQHIINDSVFTNSNKYRIMEEKRTVGSSITFNYRKLDSAYYENISVDKYTTSLKFSPVITKDFPFLREYLTTGATWVSEEYIGTASFGQTIYLRYDFTCTDANATVTINGKTFVNVYKIVMMPKIRSATTYPYASTSEKYDLYYAKGIGLIYSKIVVNSFTTYERQIRNWLVN